MEDRYQRPETNTDVERSPEKAELLARNAELATREPVGGGLLSVEEIVQAVRESRGEWGWQLFVIVC